MPKFVIERELAGAGNEEVIREHARCGGFPATRIEIVREVIDPTTAE